MCGSKSESSIFRCVRLRVAHTFLFVTRGIFIVIKCTKCGHQKIVDQPLYSSPIFKCDACGDHFYESKFKEAALYPRPVNVKEKQGCLTYAAVILGAIFVLFGIVMAISEEDASFLIYSLIGLIFFLSQIFLFWNAEKEFKKREQKYEELLNESKKRLQSKKYQDLLILASDSNETIIKLLEKYNSQNHIVPSDDVEENVVPIVHTPEKVEIVEIETEITKDDYSNQNRFCRKCGSKLFDDSVFCHCCGEKIRLE